LFLEQAFICSSPAMFSFRINEPMAYVLLYSYFYSHISYLDFILYLKPQQAGSLKIAESKFTIF
ncbi:MAG: hypothetical protein DWQ10_00045, partial [Calditrichaeota bacterium]